MRVIETVAWRLDKARQGLGDLIDWLALDQLLARLSSGLCRQARIGGADPSGR